MRKEIEITVNNSERLVIDSQAYGACYAGAGVGAMIVMMSFFASAAIDAQTISMIRACGLSFAALGLLFGRRLTVVFHKRAGTITRTRRALIPLVPGLNSKVVLPISDDLRLETQYRQSTDHHSHTVKLGKAGGRWMWSVHLGSRGQADAKELERKVREWLHFAVRE